MAAAPEEGLFALAGALVLFSLAGGLLRRTGDLDDSWPDFTAALFFGALAAMSALAASSQGWSASAQLMLAFTSAAPAIALVGAFLRAGTDAERSILALPAFRWGLFCAAVGVACFGWGIGLGGSGLGAELPGPELWVPIPTIATACVAVPMAFLALRRRRAPALPSLQLEAGALVYMIGLGAAAAGSLLIGEGGAMLGAALLYSGFVSWKRTAGSRGTDQEAPRLRAERAERAGPGRKVLIPKGGAQRVTRFRDDDPLPREEQ